MERIRWRDWDAMRCVAAECEMVVGISAGPRILSLRRGAGSNLLYHDTTDFRVQEWRLYGGHRFTVAPESEETYAPDNAACVVELDVQELRVVAPPGPRGCQRRIMITEAADGSGFDLLHVLENFGDCPWRGALWGITCVPPAGRVVASCADAQLRRWPGADGVLGTPGPGHVVLTPNGCRGKVGWYSDQAWLASLQDDATLVIHCPDAPPRHECVDEGCNLEVFTCADYVELETLSGEVILAPGESASLRQRWRLLAPIFASCDWQAIGRLAGGASASSSS